MSPLFPRAEFGRRVAKARAAMAEAGAELLLVDHAEFLAWLTGYTVSETMYRAAFLPREGEPWFVLRELDAGPCRDACWFSDIVGYPDTAEPHAVMAEELRRRGLAAAWIGADHSSYGFTAAARDRLSALLPDARFVDLPLVSDLLRAVKSPAEICLIAEAAGIADKAMAAIAAQARPGLSPRSAAAIAAACFLENGADTGETGPIVPGIGDHEFLHGVMTAQPLRDGDVLHVELIPKVRNYSARLMRPVLIGEDRRQLAPLAERLVALQDRQLAAMRPGAAARDVDAILREAILAEGLRPAYDNVTGYTLGLYGRTPRPSDFSRVFLPSSDWRLEESMVFHMYVSAGGLGFSETVVVEAGGGRSLTSAPRTMLAANLKVKPDDSVPPDFRS
ncbi:aminopeptidase P family protein [Bosea sp. F3-2]|uniref:M24 family metallopeptidase n=1 Tax=Bosea sp. F3-2 TaxID=2599640 RepID=UPI0011F06DB5|nr:Xaa-Pro peptidase family protein [Bosea sp. F3-2]QEL25337.1 aminopeptidase P family protein [Bosea sp. F3-2]